MILYHHSTILWVHVIQPMKIRPDRDCPALVYLHEYIDSPFCITGLLPSYVYEVRLKRKPLKLMYASESWLLALTEARIQGVDLDKLYWTHHPITEFTRITC